MHLTFVLWLFALSASMTSCVRCCLTASTGGYVITFPRKWVAGTATQVCVAMDRPALAGDKLSLVVGSELLIQMTRNTHFTDSRLWCGGFVVPRRLGSQYSYSYVLVNGTLRGVQIYKSVNVKILNPVDKIIIQTDKEFYKAGQKVQFRVLTLQGSFFSVSTEPYPEIYVQSPSRSRIAQWLNVSNPSGLIHRDLQLVDEPEEGTYSIVVKTSRDAGSATKEFRVEDYVLPRFEVTVQTPASFLATDTSLKLTVCAQYTFGKALRGDLSITIRNYYGAKEVGFSGQLFGCATNTINVEPLNYNDDDSYAYYLEVTVTVEEVGTGVVVQKSTSVYIARTALTFELLDSLKYAKPELPTQYTIAVRFRDGPPAAAEAFTACWGAVCRRLESDDGGILRVVRPSHLTDRYYPYDIIQVSSVRYRRLTVPNSYRVIMYESYSTFTLQKFYSPSNSSLLINPTNLYLDCNPGRNITVKLPVYYASNGVSRATVYVQAVSRGQIQFWDSLDASFTHATLPVDSKYFLEPPRRPGLLSIIRGYFYLSLSLPYTVSDTVQVLLWYTRPDGEVVSDQQQLNINKCLDYQVGMSWSTDRAEQGTSLPLTLTAQPNSICSLGVVDKSVELLSGPQTPLIQNVFELAKRSSIMRTESSQIDDYSYCLNKPGNINGLRRIPQSAEAEAGPSQNSPVSSFLLALLGRNEENRQSWSSTQTDELSTTEFPMTTTYHNPCYQQVEFNTELTDAIKMFDQAGLHVLSDYTLETRPCKKRILYACTGGWPGTEAIMSTSQSSGHTDEGNLSAQESQASGTRNYFPESWLWELSTIPDCGVYSVNRTLPDTITEWVGQAVCIHPEKGIGVSSRTSVTAFTPFFVDLTLPVSVKVGEILSVKISIFNYFKTALPVLVTLVTSAQYEILEDTGVDAAADQTIAGVRDACVPKEDKRTVVIRVRLLTAGNVALNVTATVETDHNQSCGSGEVVEKVDRISKPITVDHEGFLRERTSTKFICSNDSQETIWNLEVPDGIVKDSARAWVTVSGDLLGPTLENLGHLIRMPYGCGEQNMLNFAPLIYVMQYLKASNQDSAEVTEQLITYMGNGYQRELQYKRNDGSYSAFGRNDASGSTWLTAFVVKSYAQSSPYIAVDPEEVYISSRWLKDKQLPNGCFNSVGYVHNKRMKGGISDGGNSNALSAYVMSALLEAGEDYISGTILKAASCLDAATAAGTSTAHDVYLLALTAYAYSLAGLTRAEDIITRLFTKSTQSAEGIFWEMDSLNGIRSDALSVETTSYVLLAVLTSNFPDPNGRRLLIVKWIASRMNGQGGFASTQDTVLALQALALFGRHASRERLNLNVTVTGDGLDAAFEVTKHNQLLSQRAEVSMVPNIVSVTFAGSGCALVQAVVRYNVKDPELSEVFELSVSTRIDFQAVHCQSNIITVCATYLLNDGQSNMGIIEVNLVSGYVPEIDDLERIIGVWNSAIKRYDVEGGKVLFYINQFTDTETCVEFTAFQEIKVEDVKPGAAMIYDYYEPEFSVSETFVFERSTCSG